MKTKFLNTAEDAKNLVIKTIRLMELDLNGKSSPKDKYEPMSIDELRAISDDMLVQHTRARKENKLHARPQH